MTTRASSSGTAPAPAAATDDHTPATMEVWCILINTNNIPLGEPRAVNVGHKDNIKHLTEDIKGVYEELADVKPTDMEVWRCQTMTLCGAHPDRMDDLVRHLRFGINGDSNCEKLGGWIRVVGLQLQEYEPLVVRVKVEAKRKREDDYLEGAKSSKLARIEASKANDASVYEKLQERILDDCPRPDRDIPALPLLCAGFGEFHDAVKNSDDDLFETELMNEVDQLADAMCNLDYEKVKQLNAEVHLRRIFSQAAIQEFSYEVGNGSTTDGYLSASHGGPLLVIEYKRQITMAEPQLASYFLRLALKPVEDIFRQWRQPALGLIIRGTYISFHGLVMIDKQVRILPLTPIFPCNDSELHNRVPLYAAFGATRHLLTRIKEDAAGFVESPSPLPEIPGSSRQYPNICSLQRVSSNNGPAEEQLQFQITERLMTGLEGNHLLYLASTTDPNPQIILLKFSRQYGRELHQFCASINHAPELLALERLPGGWFGIVMEYLPSAKRILESRDLANHGEKWLEEIDKIVTEFHAQGYVHGDLRPPNFIVNDETLLLIDFDWGGRETEATFPQARLHPIVRDNRLEKHPTKRRDKMVAEYTKNEIRNRL